ncbi:hypothetical protein GS942_17175 [Rhodococcus hoagii]|nr:hypothetical protein [Prescottella equi]
MAPQHGIDKVKSALRGMSLTQEQAVELRNVVNCRIAAPACEPAESTADSALAAVYAAIEKQVGGYIEDGEVLSGLAGLVNALRRD